jgi:hypothetical protein
LSAAAFEEIEMPPPWKLVLIGGEVTLLAAFTGVGIHLAIQPHNAAFRPPALTLPVAPSSVQPTASPVVRDSASASPVATPTSPLRFGPDLLRKWGEQDRNLLLEQWEILRRLTAAIERYVAERVLDQVDRRR